MATEKVGMYRKWQAAVPTDGKGDPVPKSEWVRKRSFCWVVRWFGSDGKRFSRSFESRKEANKYAESRQAEIRVGNADEPRSVSLSAFAKMYVDLRGDLALATRQEQKRTLQFLNDLFGEEMIVSRITPLDARRFIAWYRKKEYRGAVFHDILDFSVRTTGCGLVKTTIRTLPRPLSR